MTGTSLIPGNSDCKVLTCLSSIPHNLWIAMCRHEEAFVTNDQGFASHFTYHLQLLGDHNASNAAGAVLASAISDAMFRNSFSTACEALSVGVFWAFVVRYLYVQIKACMYTSIVQARQKCSNH